MDAVTRTTADDNTQDAMAHYSINYYYVRDFPFSPFAPAPKRINITRNYLGNTQLLLTILPLTTPCRRKLSTHGFCCRAVRPTPKPWSILLHASSRLTPQIVPRNRLPSCKYNQFIFVLSKVIGTRKRWLYHNNADKTPNRTAGYASIRTAGNCVRSPSDRSCCKCRMSIRRHLVPTSRASARRPVSGNCRTTATSPFR